MPELVNLLLQRAERGEAAGADEMIARLAAQLSAREPFDVVDDEQGKGRAPSSPRSRWLRPVTVAAVAFLLVLTFGAVLWLIGPDLQNEVVDPTTTLAPPTTVTTTTLPVTTTVPVPTTDQVSAWARFDVAYALDPDAGSRGGVLEFEGKLLGWIRHGVVAISADGRNWTTVVRNLGTADDGADPGLANALHDVAVGSMGIAVADHDGVIFSADGTSWDRASTGWVAWDLEVFEGAFLAIGNAGDLRDSPGFGIYRSTDARDWTRVHFVEGTSSGSCSLRLVVADSYVIADCDASERLWRSDDGLTWTEVPSPIAGIPTADRPYCFGNFMAAASNSVVVVGDCQGGMDVWVTGDGVSWETIELPVGFGLTGSWVGLAAAGPGLVGVIETGDSLRVATSSDGMTWTIGETLMPALPSGSALYSWICDASQALWPCGFSSREVLDDPHWFRTGVSVYETGDAIFLLATYAIDWGTSDSRVGFEAQAIWVSYDAATWEPIPIDLNQVVSGYGAGNDPADRMVAVSALGDQYVFFGTAGWVWTPAAE